MVGVGMRTDCKHYESRTYASGEAVRKCVLDLAPEAPWNCPADCPKLRAAHDRRRLAVRLAHQGHGAVAARARGRDDRRHRPRSLDEAEDIVNAAGAELLDEQERKAKRKLFRKAQEALTR